MRPYLEDSPLDDVRVDSSYAIDSLAAHHSQVCHVYQPAENKHQISGIAHVLYDCSSLEHSGC